MLKKFFKKFVKKIYKISYRRLTYSWYFFLEKVWCTIILLKVLTKIFFQSFDQWEYQRLKFSFIKKNNLYVKFGNWLYIILFQYYSRSVTSMILSLVWRILGCFVHIITMDFSFKIQYTFSHLSDLTTTVRQHDVLHLPVALTTALDSYLMRSRLYLNQR